MGKCIIIAPLYAGEEADWLRREAGDLLICADGGYDAAVRCGIRPDLVVGDFDSMPETHVSGCEVLKLPAYKDDTDMVVCLREARRRGYREFRLAGCIGGRLDHTLANIQCLYDCALRGESAWMCDGINRITVLLPGAYVFPQMQGRKLSLLSYGEEARGVCLAGTEWQLDGAALTNRYPLGVSNEITAQEARLSFESGALMLVLSRDDTFING